MVSVHWDTLPSARTSALRKRTHNFTISHLHVEHYGCACTTARKRRLSSHEHTSNIHHSGTLIPVFCTIALQPLLLACSDRFLEHAHGMPGIRDHLGALCAK